MLPQQQQIRIQSRAPIDIDQEMTAPTESEPNCCSKSAAEKKQKHCKKNVDHQSKAHICHAPRTNRFNGTRAICILIKRFLLFV